MRHELSRRQFVQATAAIGAGLWAGSAPRISLGDSPNSKLQIACIGIGGQMHGYLVPELAKVDQ